MTLAIGGDAGVLTPLLVADLVENQRAILIGYVNRERYLGFLEGLNYM